jgi:apolipoprotein N-acyltransferase
VITLISLIAVAAALGVTLPARPAVAIPGGVAATVTWWISASVARDLLLTPIAVFALAMGVATAACAVASGAGVARRERARLTERTGGDR